MTNARFLHGMEVAPTGNVRLMHGAEGDIAFSGPGDTQLPLQFARPRLLEKRVGSQALSTIPVDSLDVKAPALSSIGLDEAWTGMVNDSTDWLAEHVSRFSYDTRKAMGYYSYEHSDQKFHNAVVGGVATMGALLEVVPRVFMNYEFEDLETALHKRAMRSLGLLFEWMGVTGDVDVALAYALSRNKPSRQEDLHRDYRLNTRYLTADEPGCMVMLDPNQAGNLRDRSGHNHPSFHLLEKAKSTEEQPQRPDRMQKPQALFGCPMPRAAVAKMYGKMAAAATEAGLFAATYHDERQNHGY